MGTVPIAPEQASNFAYWHDLIFYTLSALTAVFTILVGVLVISFVIKYKKGSNADRSNPPHESKIMEFTWIVIPTGLGLVMFFAGAKLFLDMRTPPANAMEVYVIGKQWMWHSQHSNGVRENNTLHVPLGKPVKLTMISQDVIHAFYIPEFRTQYHVVPGRYTQQWFVPTRVGRYQLFCNVYCGTQHSEMGGYVYVMPPDDFEKWLENGGDTVKPMSLEQSGQKVYNRLGCNNCHGAKSNMRAPSLAGIYQSKRRMTDNSVAVADEAYLRESILRPYNRVNYGYEKQMPEYAGTVTEEEVLQLISYMKTLGGAGDVEGAPKTLEMDPRKGSSPVPPTSSTVGAAGAISAQSNATPGQRPDQNSVGALAAQAPSKN